MRIDYFFDPVCPFCWVTSRWVVDITRDRDLDVAWRFISLRIINDGTYDTKPPGYEASHSKGRDLLRVAAAVRHDHGHAEVGDLYTEMGNALWQVPKSEAGDRARRLAGFDEAFVGGLLKKVGLDPGYATALDDPSHDAVLVEESNLAFERTGRNVGTPIITYGPDGPSFFGPVISTVPDHEEGLRLWDALTHVIKVGTFSELKRSNREPLDLPLLRD